MADPIIVTSVSTVQVPEGGQATFNVRLSSRPRNRRVEVKVKRVSGDESIRVSSGEELKFSKRDYRRWKTVTLTASGDSDQVNGQATFKLYGEHLSAATLTATEVDNDSAPPDYQIVTDLNTLDVMEGGSAIFHVKLSVDPGQVVSVTVGHFYHLYGLDWVDITSALNANAADTENLARAISPNADPIDFVGAKSRLQSLVNTGNLGPFANGYWGHSAYAMSPEENLLVTAHYLEALKKQATAAKMMAILGGKNPHPQSTVVGGVTCGGELSADRLKSFRTYLEETRKFVNTVYIPDLKAVAAKYPDWTTVGSFSNFIACGEFPLGPNVPADLFMPRGVILNGDIYNVQAFDPIYISEHVARSWYAGSTDYHPEVGETVPNYTGMDLDNRYSWLKAPRHDGEAMEVGPLARVLVGYGLGQAEFVNPVQRFLNDTGLSEANLLSTLGRTAARGIETAIIGDAMVSWLNELENNLSLGNNQIYRQYSMGTSSGAGFLEAPRGALGHWINIEGSTIDNYQMVVPTTWNLGPRCAEGIPGPLEQALVGVPVADPASPVEIIRVIHSFDPCIACGVHVIDSTADKTYSVKVV